MAERTYAPTMGMLHALALVITGHEISGPDAWRCAARGLIRAGRVTRAGHEVFQREVRRRG